MDSSPSGLMRCHRGHLTPAEKTFCESCGASLHPYEPPAATDAGEGAADVLPPPRPRLSLRLRRS